MLLTEWHSMRFKAKATSFSIEKINLQNMNAKFVAKIRLFIAYLKKKYIFIEFLFNFYVLNFSTIFYNLKGLLPF